MEDTYGENHVKGSRAQRRYIGRIEVLDDEYSPGGISLPSRFYVDLADVDSYIFDVGQVGENVGCTAAEVKDPHSGLWMNILVYEKPVGALAAYQTLEESIERRFGERCAEAARRF